MSEHAPPAPETAIDSMRRRQTGAPDSSAAHLSPRSTEQNAQEILDEVFIESLRRWASSAPMAAVGALAAFAASGAPSTGVVVVVVIIVGALLHLTTIHRPGFVKGPLLVPSYMLFSVLVGLVPLLAMPSGSSGQTMLLIFTIATIPFVSSTLSARRTLALAFIAIVGVLSVLGWVVRADAFDGLFPEISIAVVTVLGLALLDENTERHGKLAAQTIASLHASRIDPLTGLYRRSSFLSKVETSSLAPGVGSLFFIDIDRFKVINDTLGHKAGDELLAAAAERIKHVLRPDDFAGRIGGDEFAIFIPDMPRSSAVPMAKRLGELFEENFQLDGHMTPVTASIGVATGNDDVVTGADLMHFADLAMYDAKRHGRKVRFFDEEMRAELLHREETELALRKALRQGDVFAYLQPIIDARRNHLVAFEALGRWQKDGTIVPAQHFFASAELGNLLPDVTRAVARDVATLMVNMVGEVPLVGVNVEAGDLNAFLAWLDDADTDPTNWVVEITESQILADHSDAANSLSQAKAMGVGVILDDFGTGHSSLTRMLRLPIDGLKIDASFVREILESETARAIVSSIAHLANECDLVAIAEGVETPEQANCLLELGIHLMQGYYFNRPVCIAATETLIDLSDRVEPWPDVDTEIPQTARPVRWSRETRVQPNATTNPTACRCPNVCVVRGRALPAQPGQ